MKRSGMVLAVLLAAPGAAAAQHSSVSAHDSAAHTASHAAAASAPALPSPRSMHTSAARAQQRVNGAVRIGKWVTLGVATASAVYGFSESRRADDLYDDLERDCQADPDRCRGRDADGAYADPDFEARYQDVLDVDRRTRLSLFVSQASLLASAVLFVLDLRGDDDRPDVPYEPPRLQLEPGGDGAVRLEVRLRF